MTIFATALTGSVNAATLFEDTFSNGNTRDGWIQKTNGPTAYDYGTGGTATMVPGDAQPSALWHNFADTVLATGQTLRLSFDVKMSRVTAHASSIRFGLGYSSSPLTDGSNMTTPVDGYMSSVPFLGDNADCYNYWMDGDPAGMNWGNAYTTAFTEGALDNNDDYSVTNTVFRTVTYEIYRRYDGLLCAVTSVNGEYCSRVTYTTTIANCRFNAIGLLGPYNSGETFTYDNVKVELITHTVLFEDIFSNGNTRDGWIQKTNGPTAYDYGTDGTMTMVPGASDPSALWHNFKDTVLATGQTLRLSFDVKMSRATVSASSIRFGLGYSSAPLADGANMTTPVDGYMSSAPFLGDNGDCYNYWLDGDPGGTNWGNAYTTSFGFGALDDNDNYSVTNTVLRTVTYEIYRTPDDRLFAQTSVNGEYCSRVNYSITIANCMFNALGLMGPYNSGQTFAYDNVKVEISTPLQPSGTVIAIR